MGVSTDYPNIPEWVAKPEGYQTGAMVKYQSNIFYANFWATEPGVGDADHNGWRFYDELYDQTSDAPTAQAKIIAYIPTWRKKEGFNYANDEMYQYITHGIIAFLMFSETNLGVFEPTSVSDVKAVLWDVVNTGHQNGTRISIALGGATDYGFLNLMSAIGNNPAHALLNLAVQNVVNFVKSNNLDGVDLDLECWWGKPGEKDQGGRLKSDGPHPAGYALTLFAQRLKQAMPDKLVSATLFGTSWYGNNYDPKLADYVDWLGVMTYDLTGSWNASPVGPHSDLLKIRNQASSHGSTPAPVQESYLNEQQSAWPGGGAVDNPILSVEDTLWYWTNPLFVNWQGAGQKIPRNKIAAGVPIYGYDFAYGKDRDAQSGEVPPGYKVMQYKDILVQFPNANTTANGNIKVPGSTPRPPFISAPGSYPFAHNIYFETPDTAVTKLNFLKNVGAQGVIIWEFSNDVWEEGKSIIKALYNSSGNPKKLPLPHYPTNWMKQARGDTKLSELSIPGTHDTCAYRTDITGVGFTLPWVQCQDLSLQEQLNFGIRYIDIRCRHIADGFAIHHAAVFLNLRFGTDVRDVCINFLKANPSECIIMHVKSEHTPENNTRTFEQTFDSYVTGFEDFWYLHDDIPTLESARGKIVLLRRFDLNSAGPKGINANSWKDNASFKIPNGNTQNLYIQDQYNVPIILKEVIPFPDDEWKWNAILELLNIAAQSGSKGERDTWCINYCSGTCPPLATPRDLAGAMNGRLAGAMNGKLANDNDLKPGIVWRCGSIVMDFLDSDLILKIINLNLDNDGKSLGVVPLPSLPDKPEPKEPPPKPGPSPI